MSNSKDDEFTRRMTERAVLSVPCPRAYCAAKVGSPCKRPGGRPHLGRLLDAAAAQRARTAAPA